MRLTRTAVATSARRQCSRRSPRTERWARAPTSAAARDPREALRPQGCVGAESALSPGKE
eukprot:1575455-Alexandrium_andersonii.AAC.1